MVICTSREDRRFTGSASLNGQQVELRYDDFYPLSRHDSLRVCAYVSSKDGVLCGKRYQQWTALQDNEPWSLCPEHAKQREKRRRKENPYMADPQDLRM